MQKKVVVGMSGGVDSSVVAGILSKRGYEVTGVYIEAYNEPGCRSDQDKKDALQVALKLKIPFIVLDFRKEYKEKVIQYFLNEYRLGRTPNPDIVCNREVKFGILYDWARKKGFDYVATGHYARILEGRYLAQPVDLSKDQTYFLWQVPSERLENIWFPLGEFKKDEVRARAREWGLPNADKADSMGVCMIGELNMQQFLEDKIGKQAGDVYYQKKLVGRHEGLWFQTAGQRVGDGIKLFSAELKKMGVDTTKMPSYYIVSKDTKNNALLIGEREMCYSQEITIEKLISRSSEKQIRELGASGQLGARIRNLGEIIRVKKIEGEVIKLESKIFAPAPGQSIVLYTKDGVVAGGGIIV